MRVGPFEIGDLLGTGGFGSVHRGVHLATGVPVAVKFLQPQWAARPKVKDAFRDEVRVVAQLDHPGIVTVFDYGEVESEALYPAGTPWCVMEFAGGPSMDRARHPLTVEETRDVVFSVLDALAHAHARGILHRDIKPANVLTGDFTDIRNGLKVTDFGLARLFEGLEGEDAWLGAGTPSFMAPEQVEGRWRDQGPWTDLYAVACMTWEFLTAKPIFSNTDPREVARMQVGCPPPKLPDELGLPDGFEAWFLRMLEKDPHRRYRRAAEAANVLAGLPWGPRRVATTIISHNSAATLSLGDDFEPLDVKPVARPDGWRSRPMPRHSGRLLGAGLGLFELRTFPLVNRDAEREALWNALASVAEAGRPAVVTLHGHVGVGTTRLARALTQRADEIGVAEILTVYHDPAAGPGHGLTAMAERWLRTSGLTGAALDERLSSALGTAGHHADLATLLRGEAPTHVPEAERANWRHRVLRSLLARISAERPVVLVMDDAQWGPEAVAFARYLLESGGPPLPVLVLVVAASLPGAAPVAEIEALGRLPGALRIDVGALSPAHIAEVVRTFLVLDDATTEDVILRSGGVPLFAVQLVRDWARRGVLRPEARGFTPTAAAARQLPADIAGLWTGAIDRALHGTGAGGRTALHVAAALGQQVVAEEWAAAVAALGHVVEAGLVDGLIRTRLWEGVDGGWRFAHGLVRETLEAQARALGIWADLNRVCAEVLSRRGAEPARIGRHLLEAGDLLGACDALLLATRRRVDTFSFREAFPLVDIVERRILVDASIPAGDRRRGEAALLAVRTLSGLGRLAEAERAGAKAAEMARLHRWPDVRARALRYRGMALAKAGSLALAEAIFTQAQLLAETAGDEENLAGCLEQRGTLLRNLGDLEGSAGLLMEALEINRRLGLVRLLADNLKELAGTEIRRGRLDEARAYLLEARAIYEASGSAGAAQCLNNLGEVERNSGNLAAAEAAYFGAYEVFAATGHNAAAIPLLNIGLIRISQGRYIDAVVTLERCLALAQGRRVLELCALAFLTPCRAATYAWEAFDADLSRAALLTEETGTVDGEVAGALELAARLATDAYQLERAGSAEALASRHRSQSI